MFSYSLLYLPTVRQLEFRCDIADNEQHTAYAKKYFEGVRKSTAWHGGYC